MPFNKPEAYTTTGPHPPGNNEMHTTSGYESVEHPSHYGGKDNPLEHIKVVEALGWDYWIGNCTKYLWRAGRKSPNVLEDLKKAKFYLDAKIEMMERQRAGQD